MLDMGFIPDVEKIVSLLSPMRTTLLFSATMPKEIRNLANKFLSNPKEITVARPATTADTITQGLLTLRAPSKRPGEAQKTKRDALRKLIEAQDQIQNALVFCNRKRDVDVVYRSLQKHGYNAARLHGDMVQSVRMDTLEKFKNGDVTILVCSDVAARGLDISSVSHVFNFDVPTHSEDYVHRIGRTGRAGREGHAFTLAYPADDKYVRGIEQLIGKPIPPYAVDGAEPTTADAKQDADDESDTTPAEKEQRPRSRRRKKSDDKVAEVKAAEPAKKSSRNRKPRNDQQDAPEAVGPAATDAGWGGQMPAFMMKKVELPKRAKED